MSEQKIPEFKSIREEAAFWDTHDITDYLDEFEVVEGVYQPKEGETKTVMTIRIAPSLKEELQNIARSYDISTSSLVRLWIVEKLRSLQQEEVG